MRFLKWAGRRLAQGVGVEVTPIWRSPEHNLLGLRRWSFFTVLDIGANTGQFAVAAREAFPSATIYCFEPFSGPLRALRGLAESDVNLHVFQAALGDEEGEAEMFYHTDHSASSSLLETTALAESIYPQVRSQERQVVSVRRLDNLVEEESLDLVPEILVKMDVQGFENRVVLGAERTLRRARACLLEVCLDGLYEGQASFRELVGLMDELDFEYSGNLTQAYAADGHVIYFDALFTRSD